MNAPELGTAGIEIGTHIHQQMEQLGRLHTDFKGMWLADEAYQLLSTSKRRSTTVMGTQDGQALERMRQINEELQVQRVMKGLR